ncbi:MAG: hypothetical protein AABY22_07965 [Nanoarchaeota archaeon]
MNNYNTYALNMNDALKMFTIHVERKEFRSAFTTFLILHNSFNELKEYYSYNEDEYKVLEKRYNHAYEVMLLLIQKD